MLMRLCLTTALALTIAAGTSAQAQFSPEMTSAIKGVRLDAATANAIIKTQAALSEHVMKNPEGMKALMASMKKSPEQQIADMEKDPAQTAILKANGLSGKDYFTGLIALRAASWAVDGKSGPLASVVSPDNVAFLKANPAVKQAFDTNEMGGGLPGRPRK